MRGYAEFAVSGKKEDDARRRFDVLYQTNHARISSYALRRASTEDAAEVVAETFLIAWRRLADVPKGDEARLWLYGTARRVLANQRRSEQRRSNLRIRLGLERPPQPRELFEREGVDRTWQALARLPRRQQDLLGLIAWEELSVPELAKALGCSENAAKLRVHRAKHRLRSQIARERAPRRAMEAPIPSPEITRLIQRVPRQQKQRSGLARLTLVTLEVAIIAALAIAILSGHWGVDSNGSAAVSKSLTPTGERLDGGHCLVSGGGCTIGIEILEAFPEPHPPWKPSMGRTSRRQRHEHVRSPPWRPLVRR